MNKIIIIMGVCGCGKTTIGKKLAARIGCRFYEGDDFHPPENIEKMSLGNPLTDADRLPWLNRIHDLVNDLSRNGIGAVITCSALKEIYRQRLCGDLKNVLFVYLKGSYEEFYTRLLRRKTHFMKAEMLTSQFETLEEPSDAIIIPANRAPNEIIDILIRDLQKTSE